jgi:hypothetical protein
MKNRSSETYLVRPDRFFGNITPTRRPSMRVYEVNTITGENLSGLRSTRFRIILHGGWRALVRDGL